MVYTHVGIFVTTEERAPVGIDDWNAAQVGSVQNCTMLSAANLRVTPEDRRPPLTDTQQVRYDLALGIDAR
jgi:hypothetical protein